MTKKRFYVAKSNLIDGYCIYDKEKKYSFNPQEKRENCLNECKVLNELNDENQKLLRDCDNLIDDNTELVVELNQDSNKLKELQEENGKLKKSINEYAFISDCSVQVLNEEEDVKEDYLALSCKELHQLKEENERLKQDIENLKITIKARETLIDVCEKKFKELGFIITVDDDGYVIE